MSKQLTIGLFGFGSVGSGIYEILQRKSIPNLSLKTIVVKNPEKERIIDASQFSYSSEAILEDSEINLVLELIDDAEAAYRIVKKALQNQKNVVTANKKMLAHHLKELVELAHQNNVSLLYEAAVCGSIPILKTFEDSFSHDDLQSIKAISNGTCNYILTHLSQQPQSINEVIEAAQKAGFAESDPTLDIDGWDSKFKLIIKNYHAFGSLNLPNEILNLGIRYIQPQDVEFAKNQNTSIKLIARSVVKDEQFSSYVAPHFVAKTELLSAVAFENNAVQLQTEFAGQQLFYGKGAGSIPTGSAVFSDVLATTNNYNYTYAKSQQAELGLNNEVPLLVYISAKDENLIDQLKWIEIRESKSGINFYYRIGIILLSDIKKYAEKNSPELFICVYDDE